MADGGARDLPTFIVIGAMKSGTTSLYHYLRDHDQIFMSRIKELDFFVTEANWSRGMDWYRNQFKGAEHALARGEASTLYTKYPEHAGVPERIAAVLPDVRLIYVVRDPVERLRSHYQHRVMTGMETSPPEVALLENPNYLNCSKYAMQLEQYLGHFPREQILIVRSEALKVDRQATVQGVYDFLGVDPFQAPSVLAKEFYRTAQRRNYPAVVWWTRRFVKRHSPQAKRAKVLVELLLERGPVGVKHKPGGSPERTAEAPESAVLSPDLRERLADLLRDDVTRFRRYMPADFDGWGIA